MSKINLYLTIMKIENEYVVKDFKSLISKIQSIKDNENIFCSYIPRPTEITQVMNHTYLDSMKLIGIDGSVSQISNYASVISNLDKIREYQMKEMMKDVEFFRDESERLTHADPNKNLLDCIRGAVMQKGYFTAMNMKLDKKHDDKNTESEIMNAIIDTRKENNAEAVQNEFDIVNEALETSYPGRKNWRIAKCVYNGEEIDPDDMIYRLKTHMLPDFLTQIDIRETLDDEYEIETNLCVVKRAKGGSISIEDKTGK